MFTLERVVPWGRSFDEYRRMFALTDADLKAPILGCADGPASFNAEATARGHSVISCDPIYRFSTSQIRERIRDTTEVILDQARRNQHEFVWTSIRSLEELRELRTSPRFASRSVRTSCFSIPSSCRKTSTSQRSPR